MHYYRFNIKDWNDATAHISLEEQAVYFRLINYYYDKERPLPDDPDFLARKLRLFGYECQLKSVLKEFFEISADGLRHPVCDDLVEKYQTNAKKNRENAARGGRPRKADIIAPSGEY